MKKFTFLISLIISFCSLSQSVSWNTFHDNQGNLPYAIKHFPWGEESLYQIYRDISNPNQSLYNIEKVNNGVASSFSMNGIETYYHEPIHLENGILTSADVMGNGIEPVYFDGVNLNTFDLAPGTIDSKPEFYQLKNRTFAVVNVDSEYKIYEFFESLQSFDYISSDTLEITKLIANYDNSLIYSTFYHDQDNQSHVYILKQQYFGALLPVPFTQYTVDVSNIADMLDYKVFWDTPIEAFGNLYLNQTRGKVLSQDSVYFEILSINDNGSGFVTHSLYTTGGSMRITRLINGEIYSGVAWTKELTKCTNGYDFEPIVNFDEDQSLFEYHFNEQDSLIAIINDGLDTQKIAKIENQIFQNIYVGSHMHNICNTTDKSYFYDSYIEGQDSTNLIILNNITEEVTEVPISSCHHPIIEESCLIHDEKFTFLFPHKDPISNNILQLDVPYVNLEENHFEVDIFPNPITNNFLQINLDKPSTLEIIDIGGKLIYQKDLNSKHNEVQTSFLKPGMYFFKIENSIEKIIVN